MKGRIWPMGLLALGATVAASCMRVDTRQARIHVPAMAQEQDVRIVTNAACHQISSRYDPAKHDHEVDLAKRMMVYHEGRRLLSATYQDAIEGALREVGLEAQIVAVKHNPPPPLRLPHRPPIQTWGDRFTAIIRIPEMKTRTQANRVVDALARARRGFDDPRVHIDRASRTVVISDYNGRDLAQRNLEHAIACVGYRAADIPANLGAADAWPRAWTAITLRQRAL